jgi:hypothetical protein
MMLCMRLVICAVVLAVLGACDPALKMSSGPLMKRTIEGCSEAVTHLRECCPQYDIYLSCTVLESWEGAGTADLSTRQSRCLRASDCGAIEKAVTGGSNLCGVSFQSRRCR